jgi:hypothetical protein
LKGDEGPAIGAVPVEGSRRPANQTSPGFDQAIFFKAEKVVTDFIVEGHFAKFNPPRPSGTVCRFVGRVGWEKVYTDFLRTAKIPLWRRNMDIESLSLPELTELNRRVVERIRYLHRLKTRSQLDRFEPGDRVGFQHEGRMVEGVVVRVNQKTLSVHTSEGHWNIHPHFLTKLTIPSPKAIEFH